MEGMVMSRSSSVASLRSTAFPIIVAFSPFFAPTTSVVAQSVIAEASKLQPVAAEPEASKAVATSASFFEPFDTFDTKRWYTSDGWVNGSYQGCAWARSNVVPKKGVLELQLTKAPNKLRNYKCAEIRTNASYSYGLYEVRLRAAAASGLNTAIFTYSGPPLTPVHDEIDFEFLGKSPRNVQLNYYVFGKGGRESSEPLVNDASTDFHTYAFEWTPAAVKWYVDGRLVRTATSGMQPKTAGRVFLSLWMGSDQINNWLGKFTDARAQITAAVDWVAYTAPGERCKFPQSLSCGRP